MSFIYWALTFAFISQMTVDKVGATKSLQVITLHYIHLAEAFIRSDFPWVHSTKWIQVEPPLVKENQTESYNLLTFFGIYSTENNTKTAYLMFCLINFMTFVECMLILNGIPATRYKEVWTKATKDKESCRMLQKNTCLGRPTGKQGQAVVIRVEHMGGLWEQQSSKTGSQLK